MRYSSRPQLDHKFAKYSLFNASKIFFQRRLLVALFCLSLPGPLELPLQAAFELRKNGISNFWLVFGEVPRPVCPFIASVIIWEKNCGLMVTQWFKTVSSRIEFDFQMKRCVLLKRIFLKTETKPFDIYWWLWVRNLMRYCVESISQRARTKQSPRPWVVGAKGGEVQNFF